MTKIIEGVNIVYCPKTPGHLIGFKKLGFKYCPICGEELLNRPKTCCDYSKEINAIYCVYCGLRL